MTGNLDLGCEAMTGNIFTYMVDIYLATARTASWSLSHGKVSFPLTVGMNLVVGDRSFLPQDLFCFAFSSTDHV